VPRERRLSLVDMMVLTTLSDQFEVLMARAEAGDDAAGARAARVLARMEALLGPAPSDATDLVNQAEQVLCGVANQVVTS
jgi:hypothetical protein